MPEQPEYTTKPQIQDHLPRFTKLAIITLGIGYIITKLLSRFLLIKTSIISTPFILLLTIIAAMYYINTQVTTYTITPTGITKKRNLLKRKEKQIDFSSIYQTTISQNLLQQLQGDHGTIELQTLGPNQKTIKLKAIENVHTLYNYINKQIEEEQTQPQLEEVQKIRKMTDNFTEQFTDQ